MTSASKNSRAIDALTVYTIGHSTRPLSDFIGMLAHHRIEFLADVRTMPRSRHVPQFNTETLEKALKEAGIEYSHLSKLGGLRKPTGNEENAGWRNKSFRGYADHMQTEEFEEGLRELLERAARKRTAIMCAEAVPWRCHRSLVADALLARGVEVFEIIDGKKARPKELTDFAHVSGTKVTYPKQGEEEPDQPRLYKDR